MSTIIEVFLGHGGLHYAETSELVTNLEKIGQSLFMKAAQREFYDRLKKCHPSLILAAATSNTSTNEEEEVSRITWEDWCRFELNEEESRKNGNLWVEVNSIDLEKDTDVLMEITKDGNVVSYGCTPFRRDGTAIFDQLPNFTLNAILPQEGDVFEDENGFLGGKWYHYWTGRNDCSLQQKSICKAIYGMNLSQRIHARVVLRQRSTGKMVTIISTFTPNQIMGDDYGLCDYPNAREYQIEYCNESQLCEQDEDDRVSASFQFSLFCKKEDDEVVETQNSVEFTTYPLPSQISEGGRNASASFHFELDNNHYGYNAWVKGFLLQTMRTWKWS